MGDDALDRRLICIRYSDAILNFLYDHIDRSLDSQVRARWEPYTVVLWDNRVTAHVRWPSSMF